MLDVRRLRVLHAVSRHGSVSAAAAALGYSGPAVSQQLAALEREAGVTLTERSGRGITLTAAADILVSHTDVLFAQLAAAESDIAAFKGEIAGLVRLAAFPSAAASLVPAAWTAVATTSPHVRIELEEMEPEESLPALTRHGVDIAVAHSYDVLPRPLDAQYETRPLLEDPVLIAMSDVDGPESGDLELGTLADRPFLVPRAGTSCAEMVLRACARAGFVPHVSARATDFDVLLRLVAAGLGVALVPRLATRNLPPRVRLIEPRIPVTRHIFTVSVQGGYRKPAVRAVLDALHDAAAPRAAGEQATSVST
jgi:DNA-binding transcriptional LysR family regulator